MPLVFKSKPVLLAFENKVIHENDTLMINFKKIFENKSTKK